MTKILVVDDTAVDRRLAGGLLEASQGVEVVYAEDGEKALIKMSQSLPDLVVTDMQMPNMGGLELVSQIRLHYPRIPVVLMTAQGSEAVAVEALERGAASYVPKSQLALRLQSTVQDLLSMVHSNKSYVQLIDCQQFLEFHYDLDNDAALLDALVELVQQMIGGMGLTDETGQLRTGVALREALYNAMYHGNLELSKEQLEDSREDLLVGGHVDLVDQRRSQSPYRERRIRVAIKIDRSEARFVVEDDGAGFDYASHLVAVDPGNQTLNNGQGRGFVLMLSLMDEVSFNESGNRVTLVKSRDQ